MLTINVCVFYGSEMDTGLSKLVDRLEAVTDRLENVAGQGTGSKTSAQPVMDSG